MLISLPSYHCSYLTSILSYLAYHDLTPVNLQSLPFAYQFLATVGLSVPYISSLTSVSSINLSVPHGVAYQCLTNVLRRLAFLRPILTEGFLAVENGPQSFRLFPENDELGRILRIYTEWAVGDRHWQVTVLRQSNNAVHL